MSRLTHLDESGAARMVDVSTKASTVRTAVAGAHISMSSKTRALIAEGELGKGGALATARIAGIMAAKKTADLIPLCHPLPLSAVEVRFEAAHDGIAITATVRTTAQTGVEMEALTAASVAALTIYDMAKAAEKTMSIGGIRLLEKTGGRSGVFRAPE